jgi:hypothetical protein
MSTRQLRPGSARFRTQCGGRAIPPPRIEDETLIGLMEEVRQLRAAVAVYRHVVERLPEQVHDLGS